MDPDLEGVWSLTCFVMGNGFRRQGLMHELATAAVELCGLRFPIGGSPCWPEGW